MGNRTPVYHIIKIRSSDEARRLPGIRPEWSERGSEESQMENAFKSIMAGGDDASRAQAQDFVQRVTTGNPLEGFSDDDVKESARILQSLTPEQRKRALGASMQNINSNVSSDQRSSLNDMLKQREA